MNLWTYYELKPPYDLIDNHPKQLGKLSIINLCSWHGVLTLRFTEMTVSTLPVFNIDS